ncbi:LIM and SH3 domain protein Lasp-like [Actinia tenebrosa]|uniref:LIM and SH3 domain protein Lasp-like n=1 Tax=Actinia tenebrosa TaxID=6105 RepID=A0A6P8IDY0_ACTTE|nr:LIM and SH3 domain protein Lasp-like [Actinia tenebrosa]
MNPQCSKCSKAVYPMEKLNCLDKFWHKTCFKCTVCNMTLNMKNYKGYNKMPYCAAHYPTTKHTTVADTPENLRLSKQTKQQSQVEYHKKFEEEKGHFTAVPDDPETLRAKKNTDNISSIAYAGSSAEMRLGTSGRGAVEAGVEGSNPHQPGYEDRIRSQPQMRQPPQPEPVHHEQRPPAAATKPRYRALYDYTAADDDEVSFVENDSITDVNIIDEGWMEGRVERTGQFGMIPANYVEKI